MLPLPIDPPLAGASRGALERVREQARIQLEGRQRAETLYELLADANQPIEPGVGLAGLPPPSPEISSSTSRATPTRPRMGSTTCSG